MELIQHAAEKYPALGVFILANPFTTLFTAYRDVIFYERAPDWTALGLVALVSLAMLAVAILIFKRLEPTFAKVL